jgi:uncharacterized protein (DUF488 family)
MRVFTIGHSTQPIEALLDALEQHAVALVVDVRRFPGSRRHPQYNGPALAAALAGRGMGYRHEAALGGRRSPRTDSRNTAWRNAAFRGYADHMETAEYQEARARLLADAERQPTAILCAEKLWWQCHRSLVADDLAAAGHDVVHILEPERNEPHRYTPAARVVDGRLTYEGLLP